MSADRNSPTPRSAIASLVESMVGEQHVSRPGRVESYDAATCRASVKPLIQAGRIDEAGERQVEALPIITNVPVVWPAGYLGTLSQGDQVVLVHASASLDRWLASGGDVDPVDDRRGHLSDAFALPVANPSIVGFEPTVKATTYRTAEDLMLTAIAALANALAAPAAVAIGATAQTAATAATTAINAFKAAAASYLTTIAKVK